MINDIVNEMMQKQEMWLKAVLLKELGEESYGKTDKEIGMEAKARGYKLVSKRTGDTLVPVHEVWDKNDNVVSTFKINFKTFEGQ